MHLHIIIDSPAFTQSVQQRIHESGPENSIVLVTKSDQEIDIYTPETKKTQTIHQVYQWLSQTKIESLTAHFLSTLAAYLIVRLKHVSTVKWVVWGGDYYDLPSVRNQYVGPNQKVKQLGLKQRLGYLVIRRALRKIDYVIGNLCDLKEIRQNLRLKANFVQLNHLWGSHRFGVLDSTENQSMILVGNSDDQSNNHLMCINQIMEFDSGQDILLPLSGVTNSYTENLKQRISALYPEQVVNSLDNFLAQEEYHGHLSQCSHLVYGHFRQQGMATLFTFLQSGRVCYLQSDNPYYKYLISEGFTIFAIDQSQYWKRELSQEEKSQNKALIEALFSTELIAKQWKNALNSETVSSI